MESGAETRRAEACFTKPSTESGDLTIARSYACETTKGVHADTIPVPTEALPWLAQSVHV